MFLHEDLLVATDVQVKFGGYGNMSLRQRKFRN